MLIQCEKCSTRYNLDEAKIPGKGAKVTCPSCKHVFIVMKGQGAAPTGAPPGAAPGAAPAAPTSPRMPTPTAGKSLLDNFFDDSKTVPGNPFGGQPAPSAPAANLGGRSIPSWKVRVASGLVYDFTDVATLKAWIGERKVTTADQISADGTAWTVIGSIPNLDVFFGAPAPRPTPAPAPSMGAPGPAPLTGFGPPPTGAPAAPAFAAPAAGGSLADLFNSPAPASGADPFGEGSGAPPPSSPANPFGAAPAPASPMPPPPALGANPFAPAAPPAAPADPFGGGAADPFGPRTPAAPSANPFGGAPDPFGAAPAPAPFAAPDPFGASADPFGSEPPAGAAPAPFSAPPPPMMGPKPAPPPWLSGPAPAVAPATPAAPAAPMNAPPPPPVAGAAMPAVPATAKPASWSSAGDVTAKPAALPGKPRKIGRTIGFAVGGFAVLGLAGGLFMNLDRVRAMLRPIPVPVETPTPLPIVSTLDGEARDHYLRGRRLLRLDTAEAYAKAEAEFRAALAKANGNPRAAAGVLESLALQKQAGAAITDDALARAQADAVGALKEDPQGLETNRALAQLDSATGKPADALARLETALAARPGDAESLFLRSKLRAADPAQAQAAAEDLAAAAADKTLTRAVLAKAEGAKPKSPEQKALDELTATNAAAVAALTGGTWAATPEEFERLLPGAPFPTPAPTAAPVDTAAAVPSPGVSATPQPAASVVAATPTPAKTAVVSTSPTPAKTPVAAVSKTPKAAPTATRTPLAATTSEPNWEATPVPTEGTQIATASADDHFLAGQAFESAASWADAIGEYEQARKLAPKIGKYRLALGTAQFRAGKLQDAATTLSDLIESEPSNASAHRMLGLLFDATGQNANACGEFSEYLRLKPQAADAGDIRTRMLRNGCE